MEHLVVTERNLGLMNNIQGGNVWKFQVFVNQKVITLLKIRSKGELHVINVEVDTY